MSFRIVAIGALAVLVAATGQPGLAQRGPSPPTPAELWDRAAEAWDSGRYPDALMDLLALMDGPGASDYHARIALLTGELFPSQEITLDGRNPRVSAAGRYVSYETRRGEDVITRVVRVAPGTPLVAEVRGAGLVFDPDGARVAWLRPTSAAGQSPIAVVVRDLTTAQEHEWLADGMMKSALTWSGDGRQLIFLGLDPADKSRSDVYAVNDSGDAVRLSTQPGVKLRPFLDPAGTSLVYVVAPAGGGRGRGAGPGTGTATAHVEDLRAKTSRALTGVVATTLTMSADGRMLAWIARADDGSLVLRRTPTAGGPVTDVRVAAGAQRIDAPALSPDGRLVAYQFMENVGSKTDWDIHVTDADGLHRRLTDDVQHDLLPEFLTNETVLGLMGERRHRRSHLYDVTTGDRRRVFANNTIRTISPEYVWTPSPDGSRLAIEADRDGDTVSPAHGISVLDVTRAIGAADLRARLTAQLAAERDLRQRMAGAFQPLADLARTIVASISPTRAYRHERALTAFGSKHITRPGNARAIEYLAEAYRSFGYDPELQWLPPDTGGYPESMRSANVVATLRGTVHPELIYVVSSHFDSVASAPGADDNTSGTSALLEAARALAATPLPATVVFASFTGEESGLLGSREFVRLAAERQWRIAGALNNDMIGWSGEGGRLDNTIRYSNAGIRDVQHGAAFLFTNLILYDAKYYQGTDAAAFYQGWGDIVGGIGSYPVLGNPNYHQPTDLLDTINFAQVAETAKVTAATLVYLASSPSRLTDLRAARTPRGVELTWTPSPEQDVTTYVVAYGPSDQSLGQRRTVREPRFLLPALPPGTHVAVKGINQRGLEGWDWARWVVE